MSSAKWWCFLKPGMMRSLESRPNRWHSAAVLFIQYTNEVFIAMSMSEGEKRQLRKARTRALKDVEFLSQLAGQESATNLEFPYFAKSKLLIYWDWNLYFVGVFFSFLFFFGQCRQGSQSTAPVLTVQCAKELLWFNWNSFEVSSTLIQVYQTTLVSAAASWLIFIYSFFCFVFKHSTTHLPRMNINRADKGRAKESMSINQIAYTRNTSYSYRSNWTHHLFHHWWWKQRVRHLVFSGDSPFSIANQVCNNNKF